MEDLKVESFAMEDLKVESSMEDLLVGSSMEDLKVKSSMEDLKVDSSREQLQFLFPLYFALYELWNWTSDQIINPESPYPKTFFRVWL